jgi:tight adherence protein B
VIRWWAGHRRLPELAGVAAVVALGGELGGGFADGLDGLAVTMSDRRDIAAEARAQAAQARASAALLVLAPLVFLAVMGTIAPSSTAFLVGTPAGWATLLTAIALDLLGALWMHRLVERVA